MLLRAQLLKPFVDDQSSIKTREAHVLADLALEPGSAGQQSFSKSDYPNPVIILKELQHVQGG